MEKKNRSRKIILLAVGILITIVLGRHLGFADWLSDIEGLQNWFRGLGALGYGVFILIYIAVCVFMLPASPLTIAAGITFGSVLGAFLSIIGATIGATAAFLVAKYLARDAIVNRFGSNPIFQKIEDGVAKNGISFLILTRLVPIFPFNLQNYAYGLTAMKVVPYALVSFFTMLPGTFVYAFLAGEIATNGISTKFLIQMGASGIVLFALSLLPKRWAKKKGIALEKEAKGRQK